MIHYFPLEPGEKSSIKRLNRLQKKHLMRFHYVLNPAALVLGCFHFLLSSCRLSFMPEWGLIMVSFMVLSGIILKFQLFPRKVGRLVYRLHTTPVLLILLVFSVVTGHQFVD
jgi:cytochrome c oxidase subunit IV